MKTARDLVTEAKSKVREIPLDQAESAIRNANLILNVPEAEGAGIQMTMTLARDQGMKVKVHPAQRPAPSAQAQHPAPISKLSESNATEPASLAPLLWRGGFDLVSILRWQVALWPFATMGLLAKSESLSLVRNDFL